MNEKRGQVTVFIILGLVIVVFIGILFYVKQDLVKQKIKFFNTSVSLKI